MTDECKFEIKEDTFSAKMPLISKQEYKQLNSNIEGFARAITKLVIVDKNMAIAQHIIRKQQEKIEQLEAEKTEAIEKVKEIEEKVTEERSKLMIKGYTNMEDALQEDRELLGKQKACREFLKIMKGK